MSNPGSLPPLPDLTATPRHSQHGAEESSRDLSRTYNARVAPPRPLRLNRRHEVGAGARSYPSPSAARPPGRVWVTGSDGGEGVGGGGERGWSSGRSGFRCSGPVPAPRPALGPRLSLSSVSPRSSKVSRDTLYEAVKEVLQGSKTKKRKYEPCPVPG